MEKCDLHCVFMRPIMTATGSFIKDQLFRSKSSGGGVSDWSYDQFMARCHSSCCSGHHSSIAVAAEVSPQTACDVTFRLRLPLLNQRVSGMTDCDRLGRGVGGLGGVQYNMSCEPLSCDCLNEMRIRGVIDFVTCPTIEVKLMSADTF